MSYVKDGWFSERNDLWYGQSMSFQYDEILCHQKTKFQEILMFKSKSHGTVLVLDGCVQCTEKDEFTYQEMISYLPLNSHPNPRKVLIIGGGDGGVAREVAKHPLVETIVQCEIDEDVINFSKKYLPSMACGFSNAKHQLHIGCGKEFMKQHRGEFDVIITDSSDPIGPAATLFQKEYYQLLSSALKPDGLLCSQGECPWLDSEFIKNMLSFCKTIFPVVQYGYTNIPTYPCGQLGFLLCSKNSATKFNEPLTRFTSEQLSSMNFKLYNTEVHQAAFALPQYFEKKTKDFNCTASSENKRWFDERLSNAAEQCFSLIMEEVLLEEKVNEHNVLIFNNFIYGDVFVIDDVIQYADADQRFLQEAIVHLSMNSHAQPKKVLIIGGLSGNLINEVSRHSGVQQIIQLEKNKDFLAIVKQYFPISSSGYDKANAEIIIENYEEFLENHQNSFDVIITVPREEFLQPEKSQLLKQALKHNGVCISQVPTFWLELHKIQRLYHQDKTMFPVVDLATIHVPTSPYGQVTFILRSLNENTCFQEPLHQLPHDQISNLSFYNEKVHKASFALPQFVQISIANYDRVNNA